MACVIWPWCMKGSKLMEVLQLLGTALGISAMAGVNLYLSVFATSLALNMGWLHLSHQMQALQVLADPAIMMISGFLYFLEFFVDKIPGLDSLWDAVHTAIRPLGAMFLSLALLGQTDVTLEIVTALLCGGVAFTTHATKMGIRAVINTSPEPFTNTAASVTEDIMVAGGLALSFTQPVAAAVCVIVFLLAFAWFAPKLFRFARMVLVFAFSRISGGGTMHGQEGLPLDIDAKRREKLSSYFQKGEGLQWCFRGFTGKSRDFPAGFPAYLFMTSVEGRDGEGGKMRMGLFVRGKEIVWFDPASIESGARRRFLFTEFTIHDKDARKTVAFRLNRKDAEILSELLAKL